MAKLTPASIIIPLYNEAPFIKKRLHNLVKHLQTTTKLFNILLIENGSQDNTWDIAHSLAQTHSFINAYQLPFQSYGQAIKLGILLADKPLIYIFNLDFYDLG